MKMVAVKHGRDQAYVLEVSFQEAAQLIQSLVAQIISRDSSTGRAEFLTERGEFVTIAVTDPSHPNVKRPSLTRKL